MSSLVTGNMEFLRRPFARNIKEGDRVLIISIPRTIPASGRWCRASAAGLARK